MSYRTVAVELEDGRVRPALAEELPPRARALLTILEAPEGSPTPTVEPPEPKAAGLRRFLSEPAFEITEEQFRASMEADFWDQ